MANKIYVVTGPHEGVGKTTLAANLATRLAQVQKRPVLLIDTDMQGRAETSFVAGAPTEWTVGQILDEIASRKTNLGMMRGRIPTNRFNVGAINVTGAVKEMSALTPERWSFFLNSFVQIYDLVIDLELGSPLKTATFDMADAILWNIAPRPLSIRATVHQLEALHQQKFGFHKFIFILNQAMAAGNLDEDSVSSFLDRFRKEISVTLPFEPELQSLLQQGKPSVIESTRNEFAQGIGHLVELLSKFKSTARQNGAASSGFEVGAQSEKERAAAESLHVVGAVRDEKVKRWSERKQRIHRDLIEEINIRRVDLDTKGDATRERQLRTNVENIVNNLISKEQDFAASRDERERLVKELVDEALGLGPLEELLSDASVTEIMVNRFDQVFVERRGKITLSDKRFVDNNHVVQVIRRIISPLGRRIDESIPMVDARLKDGSRVNAIIPPLAVSGPSVTIRRFPERAFSSDDLVRMGGVNLSIVEFLKICVLLRKNIVISGGTGTGKTTILNMLSGFIPSDERIVTVEDTAELRMQQEHVVRLEARPANVEGQGAVTIRDLVKNCLRMRPDRIVVGECRGGEALDMLQAMNTGHEGSLTTVHANTPRDAFTRLETLCLMAGMDLPVWALREQIRSAVHILVQLTRMQDGSRKVTCITEVIGRNDEAILTQDIFRYVQDGIDAQGKVMGHHEAAGNLPKFFPELKARGLTLDAKAFERAVA